MLAIPVGAVPPINVVVESFTLEELKDWNGDVVNFWYAIDYQLIDTRLVMYNKLLHVTSLKENCYITKDLTECYCGV